MVMRWNEEEEGSRRCVVDGVVIVGVDGVDGVVVLGVFVLGLLAVASLSRSCWLGVLVLMMTEVVVVSDVVLGLLAHGSLVRSCGLGVLAAMVTEVSCGVFPVHVSAACVCTVPDVHSCGLSPLGVEFEKFFAVAGAPPDKEIGSDAAGLHPASPLVASALDAIIRGNRVREWGRLLVVFSVASLSRSCGEGGLGGENIINDGRGSRCSGQCDWHAEVLLLARLRVVGHCHGGGLGTGRALKGGAFK
jgi:hypothetical protein